MASLAPGDHAVGFQQGSDRTFTRAPGAVQYQQVIAARDCRHGLDDDHRRARREPIDRHEHRVDGRGAASVTRKALVGIMFDEVSTGQAIVTGTVGISTAATAATIVIMVIITIVATIDGGGTASIRPSDMSSSRPGQFTLQPAENCHFLKQ